MPTSRDDFWQKIIDSNASIRANTECVGECRDRRPAASFTSASRPSFRQLMNPSTHDFVTVEMRGLKAALVARALSQRVSVSVLVRAAVARDLGLADPYASPRADGSADVALASTAVKLSIRLTRAEGEQLAAGARSAGLSRGAFLAGLIADVPVLSGGASRTDHLAALIASSAELSTLSRNIHHLATLLREGAVRAAQEYRAMLDTLADDVHGHLALAASVLADLRPRSRKADASRHPSS
jgi:hypothetical protein